MVAALLVLGGCGNSQTSGDSSSSSSSTATSQSSQSNASTQAIKKAKTLIADGEYAQALTTLQDVTSPSTKVKNLISEVKQLIQAESDYKNGNYNSAENSTNTLQKSDTDEVQQAASGLADKISSAKSSSSSATTSSQASSTSATSDENQNTVISKFASAVGFYGKSGYSFTIDSQSGQTYTIEVRHDNQDGSVANLVGIYQYNASTGAVNKTN